jgi:hypothetical protein
MPSHRRGPDRFCYRGMPTLSTAVLPSNGWRCHGAAKRASNGVCRLRRWSAITDLVKVSAVWVSRPRGAQQAVQAFHVVR